MLAVLAGMVPGGFVDVDGSMHGETAGVFELTLLLLLLLSLSLSPGSSLISTGSGRGTTSGIGGSTCRVR